MNWIRRLGNVCPKIVIKMDGKMFIDSNFLLLYFFPVFLQPIMYNFVKSF